MKHHLLVRRGPLHTATARLLQAAVLLVLLGCAIALTACTRKERLLVHAGVGQRSALTEVAELFRHRHPEAEVNFSFKGSGYFIADITRSMEGDLYLPGEEFYLLQAVERGFITDYDPHRDIVGNFVTVILTPRGNPKRVLKVADFARPGIRVGLGNPKTCAIGVWHEKTFKRAGIWDAAQRNATLSAKCIAELGNAVQHGLVDATVVWASTAVLYLRDAEIVPIEPALRGVIRLPVGLLRFARHRESAAALKRLLLSEESQRVFRSHAYAVGLIRTDADGFLSREETSTDELMGELTRAAAAVKDPSWTPARSRVGPLIKEVARQRKTTRAGS